MAANPNWARWVYASLAYHLKQVAESESFPVMIEGNDQRTDEFLKAAHRAEIRINGPFVQRVSRGYYRAWVDGNVLVASTSLTDSAYELHRIVGLFQAALDTPVPVWNYGGEPDDYVEGSPETQVFLGCLKPKPGARDSVSVFHFGQTEKTDQVRHAMADATLEMFLDTN
jgi:hypothetical protein